MTVLDGDVDALAREMIKEFPADAIDRAMLRSSAFFILVYVEKSKKWLRITEEIKKMQAGKDVAAASDGSSCDRRATPKNNRQASADDLGSLQPARHQNLPRIRKNAAPMPRLVQRARS